MSQQVAAIYIITAKRIHQFIFMSVVIPVLILVILTVSTFLMRPAHEAKLDLLTNNMLAFAVYMTVLSSLMPPSRDTPKLCKSCLHNY